MLLPSFAQVISYAINKCSFQLQELLELCVKCTETFPKVCQILIFDVLIYVCLNSDN